MIIDQFCNRYLDEYAAGKKTFAHEFSMIKCHIRGNKCLPATVEKVEYEHIQKIHVSLAATPYLANRVLSLLSMMFTLAERWKLRPKGSNPCGDVKRFKELKRYRYLTDTEIREIITHTEDHFKRYPLEAGAILLLLYTGARCGEVKAAEWDNIVGTELHLPDSKTGQCIVFLTPQALAVLARIPRSRRWVIGPDTELRYVWASVLRDAGIKNFRLHDLRHAFASVGISADLTLGKIGPLLRHSSPETTQRYSHLIPSEGRAAAMAIGHRFTLITGGEIMGTKVEEVTEVPLTYPLVSITLRTVAVVKGRRIDNECEEVLNLDTLDARDYNATLGRLLRDFEAYVSKVIETASSPKAQDALQNILDTHQRPAPLPPADPPSLPQQAEDLDQGKLALDPPEA